MLRAPAAQPNHTPWLPTAVHPVAQYTSTQAHTLQCKQWSGRPWVSLEGSVSATQPGLCCQRQKVQSVPPWSRAPRRTQTRAQKERLPHEPIRGDEAGLFPARRPGQNSGPVAHTPSLPPSWCGPPCSGVGVFEPAASGTTESSLRTWGWRVRRSPCPSCPTTHPPYVPRPSAVDHLIDT